jgi:D-tyrosyl-tRNA(Tyr) deacylase
VRGVVQRVKHAGVKIQNQVVGAIEHGIMLLLGVEDSDENKDLEYMVDKVVNLRIWKFLSAMMDWLLFC